MNIRVFFKQTIILKSFKITYLSFKTGHVQNLPAFKIHPIKINPVKFENRLPIEGKG